MGHVKAFFALFGLGFLGVLSLLPAMDPIIAAVRAKDPSIPVSDEVLRVLMLVQPTVLLAAATVIGLFLAHRIGLSSRIADRLRGGEPAIFTRHTLAVATAGGLLAGVLIIAGDMAFSPWTGAALEPLRTPKGQEGEALLTGLLYGGITEELLVRWGLLTFLAWLLHRIGLRLSAALGVAVILSALLFGIGHLPALFAAIEPTPMVIIRTIALNAIGGCIFGWLYVRHHLEAAMLAHAVTHLVFFAGRMAGISL